ncbi:anti-sigma factor [Cryobacterium adonitolivorans]|uniref:Regulator of SigK n=1 Tax=Cryobacterium adonitolivorans TaxID=1259189 RepID=A0A4R8W8L8_9MICO|nr:anti-sigma factor [Cryobacterium adonitolivorans]TFC04818.1 anti-sigma factor [Cryobacterium adonitolivorans]
MSGTDKPDNDLAGNGSTDNPADLAGAYALHALSADEAAEYERYLTWSEEARVEAAELSDTAVALSLSVAPVQPSSGLKASLMAQLATTPQLAPLTTAADSVKPAGSAAPTDAPPAATPFGSASSRVAEAAPASSDDKGSAAGQGSAGEKGSAGNQGSAAERAQRRWFQRPAGYLVAAAAAAALFVGGTFAGQALYGDPSQDFAQVQAASLAEINAAPDSQRASTQTLEGQDATLVWSGELGLSAIIVDDLPALGDDQDYQLWYIGSSGPVSAGTFDSDGSGTAWRVLDGTMSAGDAVGVTVEPAGGSEQPTTDPIVAIQS